MSKEYMCPTRTAAARKAYDFLAGGRRWSISWTAWTTSFRRAAFRQVLARGFEWLVAKDPQAAYLGGRFARWLKVKRRQEGSFVIGGYTQEEGHLAALLVGGYRGGQLHSVGEVTLGLRALRRHHATRLDHGRRGGAEAVEWTRRAVKAPKAKIAWGALAVRAV